MFKIANITVHSTLVVSTEGERATKCALSIKVQFYSSRPIFKLTCVKIYLKSPAVHKRQLEIIFLSF